MNRLENLYGDVDMVGHTPPGRKFEKIWKVGSLGLVGMLSDMSENLSGSDRPKKETRHKRGAKNAVHAHLHSGTGVPMA
jgi:hypothetical protein